MPTTKTVTLYQFDELSDKAKEKARDWWRECENESFGHDWPNFMQEDWETVGNMLGIEFDQRRVVPMGGEKYARHEPKIWWHLGYTQGDGGASFEGTYTYSPNAVAKIRDHAPQDKTLHGIADDLEHACAEGWLKGAGTVKAKITESRGNIQVETYLDNDEETTEDTHENVKQAMRDFAAWIYTQLRLEHEYRMSDENVDESIRINEYTFLASGKRED